MPLPDDIARLRAQRDAALTAAIAATDRMRILDGEIERAQRAGRERELFRLRQERAAADGAGQRARTEHGRLADGALVGLGEWLGQTPEQIVEACSDAFPFVLMPVRIETKFAASAAGTELRVRLFPDNISIAAPLAALTATERGLGEAYWRTRAAARHQPADAVLRGAYEGAWNALAAQVGPYRAGHVVRATAPENPDPLPEDLRFRDPDPPQAPPVPRADLLPDRFVVLAYASIDGVLRQVTRVVGNAIPDDLSVGPDPSQPASWLDRDETTGRLIIPDALKWMVDFDAAVSVGMAVRTPISAPHDTAGFDRLIAVGVRSTTSATDAPAALEALLAKHRYGEGLALARAGIPTNNTDSAVSGWRPPSDEGGELFAIEDRLPDIAPGDGPLGISDGWRLRGLLGLSDGFAQRLPGAKTTDIAEAIAMNHAAAPGTIDEFAGEFLKGLVSPAVRDDLHRFFVRWVSGRGHFPALRVGRQPYGVVLTSSWKAWHAAPGSLPFEPSRDIAPRLHALLAQHRPHWEALARVAPHAAQTGGDPFQRLLSIVGLLASSSEYVSRRAISDEYVRQRLQFGGADPSAIHSWFAGFLDARNRSLNAMGFPAVQGPTDPLLAFIVFMRDTHEWRLPLVDRDPTVPLSETEAIAPFDGVRNYLHWLGQASRDDMRSQRFTDAGGRSISPPQALLYVLLRHSYLTALEAGTLDAAQLHGSRFFNVVARDPLIANIGSEQHILRRDYLEVDASRLGLTRTATRLADWTLTEARGSAGQKPPPVQRVSEVHDAISALSGIPTARLERLLAEHVDICSYRLDAWVTALYAQRLELLHARSHTRGLHLGTFGWIENLRPASARRRLSPDTLPEVLRNAAGPDVFEDAANGGYVHAPSLLQATTAAVLRNGYLSHASSAQPLTFAVNLSSARARAAVDLMQGVRNGQPIAALLGYQLERGLHEGHPGVELDRFTAVLRDRFPLVSGRLTELPPGISAEVVEARNVVDGLALVEATKGQVYPYGTADLPVAGTPEAFAIVAEVDRLHDALDAVSDLLLSESVHQAVQGNLARTQATLQALTAPEAPPEPEIIRTPRSGRVYTFRMLLALDPDANTGWSGVLSPRARVNPQLNHWLSLHLPHASDIRWTVRNGTQTPSVHSLADLGLEPIDVVLMGGDRLGNRTSELERTLIRRYRATNGVPDDRVSVIVPASSPADPAAALVFDFADAGGGGSSLAAVHPVLVRLHRLIAQSRAADAADWRRAADTELAPASDPSGSASGDPRLVNFKNLTDRLDAAANELTALNDRLKDAIAAAAPLHAALEVDADSVTDPAWSPALDALREALFALVPFGLPEALPLDGLTVTVTVIESSLRQGQATARTVDGRLAAAAALRATAFPSPLPPEPAGRDKELARRNQVLRRHYGDAAKSLLGSAFAVVPLFCLPPGQANEVQQALAVPAASANAIEEWLHSAARVRPRMSELTWALAATRWLGRPIGDPAVAQLPHRPGSPWVGEEFPADPPQGEWLSLCIVNAAAAGGPVQAGLILDDWTETVPSDRETTGVAFNFNRPNAVAPQALLVAVPPEMRGHWTWDDLVGSIHEALDLAKLRAVEPDALIGRATATAANGIYFQALPAILTEFSEGRLAVTDLVAHVAAALQQPST